MKKEIEAFVNAANEQELEAAWNNLSAEEQRIFEQLMEEDSPEDALAFFAQLYDDTPKEQASAMQQRERKRERLAASRCFFCCSPFGVDCAPCSSPAAARSPRSSSSQVTPNTSAMTGISARSGAPSSRSQRETDLSDTFNRSASSFCVMPFARRRAARKLPIVFFSIKVTSFWSLDGSILPPRQRECHPAERDCLSRRENFTPPRPISAAPSRRAAVRAPR